MAGGLLIPSLITIGPPIFPQVALGGSINSQWTYTQNQSNVNLLLNGLLVGDQVVILQQTAPGGYVTTTTPTKSAGSAAITWTAAQTNVDSVNGYFSVYVGIVTTAGNYLVQANNGTTYANVQAWVVKNCLVGLNSSSNLTAQTAGSFSVTPSRVGALEFVFAMVGNGGLTAPAAPVNNSIAYMGNDSTEFSGAAWEIATSVSAITGTWGGSSPWSFVFAEFV